eukprot:TRINITY_DN78683_c0_g1_i1.p1 TRINITY_DN78683_c0_g1~~TRINITY_DN78683_c0_g1_i1.p1  ORF type:complete len:278 (+),score=46.55 TRINITY_DN78683_c0_g1_i1:65-898(+)
MSRSTLPSPPKRLSDAFALQLDQWVKTSMQKSKTVTSVGIARALQRVTADGEINSEDEGTLRAMLVQQQQVWGGIILMDALTLAMCMPLLVAGKLVPPAADDILDPLSAAITQQLYIVFVNFAFYATCLHTGVCLMFYIMTSYLADIVDIAWFFMTFSGSVAILNASVIPFYVLIASSAALGNALVHGFHFSGLIGFVMCVVSIACLLCYYLIVKRKFTEQLRCSYCRAKDIEIADLSTLANESITATANEMKVHKVETLATERELNRSELSVYDMI